MPVTFIRNIGQVEYERATLPAGIKGKSKIGDLYFPILISEELEPGTKLDYIVAHEVGHRLTLDMIINAYKERPEIFAKAPAQTSALVRYFIDLGLTESSMSPKHPGTKNRLSQIFRQNAAGQWTDDLTAREFIAEVYANWATNTGHIPRDIAYRFESITESKNIILKGPGGQIESEVAAFDTNISHDRSNFRIEADQEATHALLFLAAVIGAIIIFK